jgi:hypothetical protein
VDEMAGLVAVCLVLTCLILIFIGVVVWRLAIFVRRDTTEYDNKYLWNDFRRFDDTID